MSTFVWTGVTNNTYTTGTNWNVGGVPQVAPPTAADDVAFGTGTGATNVNVTIGTGAVARSVDFTGYTGTATHTAGVNWAIGDGTAGASNIAIKLVAGMTYTLGSATTSLVTLVSTSATQQTITSAGKTFGNFTINGAASSYLLSDAFTSTGTLTITTGALDTGSFSVTALAFVSTGAATRSLTAGTTTFSLTSTATATVWNAVAGGNTLSVANSTIVISTTATNTRTFTGAAFSYGTLTYTVAGSTGILSMTSAQYIDTLNFSDVTNARTIQFTSAANFAIKNFNVQGTSGKLMTVKGITGGSAALLQLVGPVYTMDYLSIQDINSVLPYKFYAGANSTLVSGNTGIILTAPVTQPYMTTEYAATGTGTSITVTLPFSQSVTANDLIVLSWGTSATAVTGLTPPSGYTLIDNTTTANSSYLYYKIAAGGETGVTFTTTSSHSIVSVRMMVVSGWVGTPTLDVNGHTDSVAAITSQANNSLTNSAQPAYAIATWHASGNTGTFVSISNSWHLSRALVVASEQAAAIPLTATGAQQTTFTWTTSRGSSTASAIFIDVSSGYQPRYGFVNHVDPGML